jgi:hypothetical protein
MPRRAAPSCMDPRPAAAHPSRGRRHPCSSWLRWRPGPWARPQGTHARAQREQREPVLRLQRCAWPAAWRPRRPRRPTRRGASRGLLRRRASRSRSRGERAHSVLRFRTRRAAALRPRRARTRAQQADAGRERREAVTRRLHASTGAKVPAAPFCCRPAHCQTWPNRFYPPQNRCRTAAPLPTCSTRMDIGW